MSNRTVAQNHHYKLACTAMHHINALLIAVEQHGIEMDSGDVLAAIGGIQAIAINVSRSLDKLGDMEVLHG